MIHQNLVTPLVEQNRMEEAAPGTFGGAMPTQFLPEVKNYALDEEVAAYVRNELWIIMNYTRQERQILHDEWHQIRNMNLMRHDSGRRYFGRSDSYLPVYRRTRANLVASLSRGLFPSDEYFDVTALNGDPESAKPLKAYMQWEFDRNAKLRSFMKPFLSQLIDYGTSPMKFWYKKELKSKGRVTRRASVDKLFMAEHEFKDEPVFDGLAVSPRNLLYWFIYPITAESTDDATVIFEDIDVSSHYVKEMKENGRWENTDLIARSFEHPDHSYVQQELLAARGGVARPGIGLGESAWTYTVSEVWTLMPLPASAYLPHEKVGTPLPVRVVMMGPYAMEVTRNPFYHQKPPYLVARQDWEPGFFYGNATGRTVRPLQLLSNDFMNQTNDNGIYALNPVAIVNPNLMVGPLRSLSPGCTWYSTDPANAVRFDRPPLDQTGLGLQMVQQAVGMAQDFSGGMPFSISGGGMAGKGSKTATGAQILQRNAAQPLQDQTEDIETEVMVPLLYGAWRNAMQYREKDVMVAVAGGAIQVTPEDLAIEAEMKWMASSQAVNSQVRAQQAISLIQAIAPIVPLLMQQGYIVDFVGLIQRVYSDGFGFRGFKDFIRKAQAAPNAMPGQPIPPEQLPGVQAEQGDRMRSALEQVNGRYEQENPAQPGEAEDFMQVRGQADDLAAMLGSMGGGGQQ